MKVTLGEVCQTSQIPSQAEIRNVVNRILGSKYFANAPTKQRFLQLICDAYLDGRASELNEYMIGCEVYGRDDAYNPALDPIVRVGAHGLRKKLESYYKGDGKDDEIILEVPIGSYIPVFTCRVQPPEVPESAKVPTATSRSANYRERIWIALLSLIVAFLIITVFTLGQSNKRLRQQYKAEALPEKTADIFKHVWQTFMKDGNPALLVLGNPPVYRFWNPAAPSPLSRSHTSLTSEQAEAMENILTRERLVIREWAPPRLVLSYDEFTSLGDTIGLYRISKLFNKMGKEFLMEQSRRLKAEDLKNHDAILLGSGWVNEWVRVVPVRRCFTTGPGTALINRNLLLGEDEEYSPKYDGENGKLIEDYAIITVKPGISERNTLMVLAGTHSEGTQAAAEYLTDENYLTDLNQRLLQPDGTFPRYFQVLLKVSVDNGVPTNISVVTARELNSEKE